MIVRLNRTNFSKQTLQAQYKNQYPVVFVHGFGLVGEDALYLYPNYWGG